MPTETPSEDFDTRLKSVADRIERTLDTLLGSQPLAGEVTRPGRLVEAMRYSTLGGGKRLRPFLVVETARLFGVEGEGPLRAGAALEMIHCYSLVHDDLPAMDDDDLRRGRPTAHKAFDEATAILSGDALLTYAFDVSGRRGDPSRPGGPGRAGPGLGPGLGPRRHGGRSGARSRGRAGRGSARRALSCCRCNP